jgi:[ribosomal protein S5]-alanine N-acetyltransferase
METFKYSLEKEQTERLWFRPATLADFDTWLIFCAYPDSLKYIFGEEQLAWNDPYKYCEFWFQRIFTRYQNGLGGMNVLIEKSSGNIVGMCGLLVQTIDEKEELEIGYSLMPEYRGKGFALEAARKCKEFAIAHQLSESLISVVHVDNEASARVARNNGMFLDKTTVSQGAPVNVFRVKIS